MQRKWGLVAVVAVGMLLLVGCEGGYGPTLPSPDGGGGVGPGQLCITVLDGNGDPLEDAYVYVGTSQTPLQRSETGSDGVVCFENLAAGQYAMTVAAVGWATDHSVVEVTGEDGSVTVTLDQPVTAGPTECPVATLEANDLDEDAGTVMIEGTVTNTDSDTVLILQDGQPVVVELGQPVAVQVGAGGSFSQLFFLRPGVNRFQVVVGNAVCTHRRPEEPLGVTWTPPAGSDFLFRVTLTWNAQTDPDLHTWMPNLSEHSSYWNEEISAGELDVDNTTGFGPENFTARQIAEGRWRVAINSYSMGSVERYAANVRVITGGLAQNSLVRTFGPHTFTTSNGEDYPVEPPNWWRPFDIIVSADGNVSVVSPDNIVINEDADVTAASAK